MRSFAAGSKRDAAFFCLALLLACSMLYYRAALLQPRTRAMEAPSGVPHGNGSDLFPPWVGTRELLLHRNNPYARETTALIQRGFYGRELDLRRPGEPTNEQRFAYPVYAAFLLAPIAVLPFETAHAIVSLIFVLLLVSALLLWFRVVQWRPSGWEFAALALMLFSSVQMQQALRLVQLTVLVWFLIAGGIAALVRGRFATAGVLLALACIKPQTVVLLLLFLAIWVSGDWRSRRRLAGAFAATLLVLEAGSELLYPGWIRPFLEGAVAYRQYYGISLLEFVLPRAIAKLVAAALLLLCGLLFWRMRRARAESEQFSIGVVGALAANILILPGIAGYNHILLLPALMFIARRLQSLPKRTRGAKFSFYVLFALLLSPWLSSLTLVAASLLARSHVVERFLRLPLYFASLLPVVTLLLLGLWIRVQLDTARSRRIALTSGSQLS